MTTETNQPHFDSRKPEFEFLSEEKVADLNYRQQLTYAGKRERFIQYLRERGKEPHKSKGYTEGTVRSMARRVHQVFEWVWEEMLSEEITTTLTHAHADAFVESLHDDEFRRNDGDRYNGDSKRKFVDALEAWFRWEDNEWESDIAFSSDGPIDNSDPFSRGELDRLWQASLRYKSVPSYNNLSPEERDRWQAHIAQELGKPKSEVQPEDWEKLNHCWKIPSLIRTNREAAWRSAIIGKIKEYWYHPDEKAIIIPRGEAIKNDERWVQKLSDEAAETLEHWLAQRENMEKYDGRDEIWLNRNGNPYNSTNLNNLLDNLMQEADINQTERKLTWHSFRHSVGTYTFEEYKNLKIVAEMLRQKSKESAEHYVHIPPEMKRDAASKL